MLQNRIGETRNRFAWFPVCKMARPNPFTKCIGYITLPFFATSCVALFTPTPHTSLLRLRTLKELHIDQRKLHLQLTERGVVVDAVLVAQIGIKDDRLIAYRHHANIKL